MPLAFKFWKWLTGGGGSGGGFREVSVENLFSAAADYTLRRLSYDVCVDMIANALGRCEFRTYRGGAEIRGQEYWLWNFEPGVNASSSVFLHKLVHHLYRDNEALVVSQELRPGIERLAVADAWQPPEPQVFRQNVYAGVTVDGLQLYKIFREEDVLHFRLNQEAMRPVTDALGDSWAKMAALAMAHYKWDRGQHWIVRVNQLAGGGDDYEANFAKLVQKQVKPFFDSDSVVLPEFDGNEYRNVGGNGGGDSRDLRALADDIFDFTARGFLIPAVLVNGKVEATADANDRFLTWVIDPLCDQLQEEITRKRYGYEAWARGDFLQVDSSSILHYDLFGQAASVEKLIGSGVYSINDIRRAAGQPKINEPWADEHYMTLNISRMEDVVKALKVQEGENE